MSTTPADQAHKQAAIEQWTADPCGAEGIEEPPGSRPYAEQLLKGRAEYAPWLADTFDYGGARGLDVLDIGCGQGIDVMNYALNGAQAVGVDLTPRHVELARAHLAAMGLPGEIVEGDAESLPFGTSSFDRVSSNGVLHHTPDIDAALREAHRVLRPGGEATIVLYNRRSAHYWIEQVLHEGLMRGKLVRSRSMEGVLSSGVELSSIGARPLVRVYSPGQLRRKLRAAGFGLVGAEVRHFLPSDTFITLLLHRRGVLYKRSTRDRIGRLVGWYVVGRGVRAA
jgi:ubiquinone/menaquinone biosynthesis C-methylase UbiE